MIGKTQLQLCWSRRQIRGIYKMPRNCYSWRPNLRGMSIYSCYAYPTSSGLTNIIRLQAEKRTWDDLLASTAPPKPSAETAAAESSSQPQLNISPRSINPTLLDPSQADHLQTLLSSISLNPSEPTAQTSTLEATKTRIGTIASSLEFKIDKLADGAHKLEQYTAGAQRLADRVLAVGAEKLEERDRSVREKSSGGSGQVDALDRLRGLSRVMNRRG
jgi:kinetochore protein Mis13/DSN1